ncbi:MAG: efflux RND transporter permease subunit [Bacteroidia bacterium]
MIKFALRKPIAVIVIIAGLVFFSFLAAQKIAIDIFPAIDLPTIYVSQPYGGMSPQQMEALISTRYEDHFLYVSGIKSIEVKNIQGAALVKLSFYEGTDMAQAAGEVANQVTRSKAFMPPGTVPPIVMRFDASSLPVGELVFNAPHRTLNELQEFAGRIVRPMFSAIPGVSSPPPIGGSSRTIVVTINPELLRSYNLTPDEVVKAIAMSNQIAAAGDVNIGNTTFMTPANTLVKEPSELLDLPIKMGTGPTVFLKDIASVEDAGDVTTGYALVNGRRAVFIPVLKRAEASTWDVVQRVKKTMPQMQAQLPSDVKISYEFDQSVYVINSVKSLMTEGITGAILTGLMVLLFLGDARSALIVILTIPVSIMVAILMLMLCHQTINIMTLSGLALAIGVLVDQATVAIENIHQHLEMGKPKAKAILEASREMSFPLLLILLCVLAVFAPSFIMTGVPKSLFTPLSLSVGFAMIVSYLLSQTFVPIMANWILKTDKFKHHEHTTLAMDKREIKDTAADEYRIEHASEKKLSRFDKFKKRIINVLHQLLKSKKRVITIYMLGVIGLVVVLASVIGRDILPKVNSGQFQLRLREPDGTRFERTEEKYLQVIDIIKQTVGEKNVSITSGFVGSQPATYAVNNIFMFSSGPQEAMMQVNLNRDYLKEYPQYKDMDDLKEKLRQEIHAKMPEMKVSFEPIELVDKVMSEGSPTPVEIIVSGKNLNQGEVYADTVMSHLRKINFLRDVQIAEPLKYPTISIHIDRVRAAQFGLNISDVTRSLVAATSSSRYTDKIFWMDQKIGMGYQVEVEVPHPDMNSMSDMENIPLMAGKIRPLLRDVATLQYDTIPGEIDRIDGKRVVTITANIYKKDLGRTVAAVNKAIAESGQLPRGLTVEQSGLTKLLSEILGSLQSGLLLAVLVIFLLLAANYQSFKLSLIILSAVPAVIAGSLIALLLTGSTLNLQSYMGIIMSIGVSVANAILLVTNSESVRLDCGDAEKGAIAGANARIRPILMTTLAMTVGMLPMAAGMGDAGEQSAPLGRAVIGGLIASTLAVIFILPIVFAQIQNKTTLQSVSLDPEDPESNFYKEHKKTSSKK